MISVDEALSHVLALAAAMPVERIPLREAAGRVLAENVAAQRDQPPFAASAMDGYAIHAEDYAEGACLTVIGEAAAGDGFTGSVQRGEAVRIFTGAPLPHGTDWVVIQEDVTRDGDTAMITAIGEPSYVRPAGTDFRTGSLLKAPTRLTPNHIALLAAMNVPNVPVARKPDVALISTGTELVMPGEAPGPDQIIASNTFGLKAMLEAAGALVRILPIAHDTAPMLRTAFELAKGADLTITIGGASVGDHDLVADVAGSLGMDRAFYKIAMRPGKPLMAGRLQDGAMLGLPGNPVSAMVCGRLFAQPLVEAMLGLPAQAAPHLPSQLAAPVPANGPRAHYMRARLTPDGIIPAERQDSALLSVLAEATVLLFRPPHDPAREIGHPINYVPLTNN